MMKLIGRYLAILLRTWPMSRRWLVGFVTLQVALASAGWALNAWMIHKQTNVPAPALRTMAAVSEPPSSSFFANMRGVRRVYITDPLFAGGAVCDGVHDDTAAINAALAYAKGAYTADAGGPIFGTVVIPHLPTACMVSSPIQVMYPAHIEGEGSTPEQSVIRASTTMQEVLYFRPGFQFTSGFRGNFSTDRAVMTNFTLDANHLAKDAIRLVGGEWSILSNVNAVNGVQTGYREVDTVLPLVLSSVTPGGGGVAGVTVTQADPNYQGFGQDATFPVVAKVVDPGALDTATITISLDGGATFAVGKQSLSALTNLAFVDAGGPQFMYGVTMAFPVHNYVANETYSFTAATQTADYNLSEAGVAEMTFKDLALNMDGPIYASAGQASVYNGYNVTTTAGTCTSVTGSTIITCPSVDFSTFEGFGYLRGAIFLNGVTYQVPTFLTKHTLSVTPGTQGQITNFTGDYGIALGGGYYADGHLDGPDQIYSGGNANFDSICYQFTGLTGHLFSGTTPSACGLAAFSMGDGNELPFQHNVMLNMHIASQAGSGAAFLISPNSSGEIVEPSGALTVAGNPVSWAVRISGSLSPLYTTIGTPQNIAGPSTWIRSATSTFVQTTQVISAANQQITGPAQALGASGGSTYVLLAPQNNFTLTATPLIPCPNPLVPGVRMILQNAGPWALQFLNQYTALSSVGLNAEKETLGGLGILELISTGNNNPCWREISHSESIYGFNWAGNTGVGTGRVTTVSSATPVPIYQITTNDPGVSNGIALSFDLAAQSLNGANIGFWHDCSLLFDKTGVVNTTITCDVQKGATGGVAGGIPLGWAISVDPSGSSPSHINVAGDVSANEVIWNIQVYYHGPGQGI